MTSKSDRSSTSVNRVIADTYRAEWGRLLSMLVARTRRLDLAEDALGEAFARASTKWRTGGVPENPAGWLFTTAWRQIIGAIRAEAIGGRKARLLTVGTGWVQPSVSDAIDEVDDERLALILLCSHPALRPESRSSLALRLVIGTSTAEIARLFLVPVPTMAARITRAKKKIVAAGIPLALPVDQELNDRLADVCRTIYLAFTAGYTPGDGPDLLRTDLAGEAVELATVLYSLVPDSAQVRALRGLLLLQHARRDARVDAGKLVTLADQDRSRWRADEVRVGLDLVDGVEPGEGYTEELRLQGLIAAEHGRAVTAADTNWQTIARHYASLESLTGSPVVRLNRAVAVAEADGAAAGLELLEGLDDRLSTHRLHAVRAELADRAGRTAQARASYLAAIRLCSNEVERRHLTAKLDGLDRFGGADVVGRPPAADR